LPEICLQLTLVLEGLGQNGHPRAAIAIAAPPAPIINNTSDIATSAPGCANAANSRANIFFIPLEQ
jgi:hypothetical protein